MLSIGNVNQDTESNAGHLEKLLLLLMMMTNTIPVQTHKVSVPAKNSFMWLKEKRDSLYTYFHP
jgi:hypothetical protein